MSSVKPSKSWEIPARPKPGRKPLAANQASNKDSTTSHVNNSNNDNSKSSQKAHRERKANYITELEAKVRAYEVEDGTKAVFFQRVAQKLKVENDALKQLVEQLRAEVTKRPVQASAMERRGSSTSSYGGGGSKRTLSEVSPEDSLDNTDAAASKKSRRSSTSSSNSSRGPQTPLQEDSTASEEPTTASNSVSEQSAAATTPSNQNAPLSTITSLLSASEEQDNFFPCGLCTEDHDGCACRDPLVALQVPNVVKDKQPAAAVPIARLPINLKKSGKSVWKLNPAEPAKAPSCSGNPSDCPACADDKQGQEFCRSLRTSVPMAPSVSHDSAPLGPAKTSPTSTESPIYCSDAWMELRSHPNIASANLQMLAEVVSHHATDADDDKGSQQPQQQRKRSQSQSTVVPADTRQAHEAAVRQEWRRRLVIKRYGLDEAIKMLDQSV